MLAQLKEPTPVEVPRDKKLARGRRDETTQATAETATCPSCFGTGMEVVAGRRARRCHCRTKEAWARLTDPAAHQSGAGGVRTEQGEVVRRRRGHLH